MRGEGDITTLVMETTADVLTANTIMTVYWNDSLQGPMYRPIPW